MAMNDIEKEVKEILAKSKYGLTEADIDNASDFIAHGEYGVALELISEQLYENEARVDADLLDSVQKTAFSMGLDKSSWAFLDESLLT